MHLLSVLSLAIFANYASATTYAQFCNDFHCRSGCGISVSVDNPGCLNENGRKSIKFHGENSQFAALIFSPRPNCPCQNYCQLPVKIGNNNFCHSLAHTPHAKSFRFIGDDSQECPDNNC